MFLPSSVEILPDIVFHYLKFSSSVYKEHNRESYFCYVPLYQLKDIYPLIRNVKFIKSLKKWYYNVSRKNIPDTFSLGQDTSKQ